jgi:hypothetical protein
MKSLTSFIITPYIVYQAHILQYHTGVTKHVGISETCVMYLIVLFYGLRSTAVSVQTSILKTYIRELVHKTRKEETTWRN